MSEKPPLRPEEVRRILRDLRPLSEERRIVLVGGQAVAFWAAFFELEAPIAEEKLFTSKDIDFEGTARSARRAGELLGGEVRIATLDDHTPNTGVVFFRDSDGEDREVDFISSPYGLDSRDVRDSAVKLIVPSPDGSDVPVWVMHPERCMESRVYNVVGLKQSGRGSRSSPGCSAAQREDLSKVVEGPGIPKGGFERGASHRWWNSLRIAGSGARHSESGTGAMLAPGVGATAATRDD